ncbi:MAG TPA: flavodoxin domain-containing protein, partial [Polyangiaceae bacterium]|nr:flavodoxin domain-containing protein [Polyangiaceae bacterium]
LMPMSDLLARHLGKARDARIIAPDHGPIWRSGIDGLLTDYETWATRRARRKLVIAYDTMWQSTAAMARAIAEGAADLGVEVVPMRLGTAHRSDVVTELLDAAGLLIGTPNLNGQMYPTVADLLTYLKGLKPRGLVGGAFGSYGWSPAVGPQIVAALQELKVDLVGEPLLTKFVPRNDSLIACRAYGEQVARKILEVVPG